MGVTDFIDLEREKRRLESELEIQRSEINKFEKKLANKNFLAKAPESVVEAERERLENAQAIFGKLTKARERVVAAS